MYWEKIILFLFIRYVLLIISLLFIGSGYIKVNYNPNTINIIIALITFAIYFVLSKTKKFSEELKLLKAYRDTKTSISIGLLLSLVTIFYLDNNLILPVVILFSSIFITWGMIKHSRYKGINPYFGYLFGVLGLPFLLKNQSKQTISKKEVKTISLKNFLLGLLIGSTLINSTNLLLNYYISGINLAIQPVLAELGLIFLLIVFPIIIWKNIPSVLFITGIMYITYYFFVFFSLSLELVSILASKQRDIFYVYLIATGTVYLVIRTILKIRKKIDSILPAESLFLFHAESVLVTNTYIIFLLTKNF